MEHKIIHPGGVILIEPKTFHDSRGFFLETYNLYRYADIGLIYDFVQDNLSFSTKGVLRGLHFQSSKSQGKLVSVVQGEVYDVAVDVRRDSPSFGTWVGATLSSTNKHQLFIPRGFAHGFCVLSETALFMYKCDEFYDPAFDCGVAWNDPDLNIDWMIDWMIDDPIISEKDSKLLNLKDISKDKLPNVL